MIEVRGGQHDARRPQPHQVFQIGPAGDAAAAVAPGVLRRIEPPPVRQAAHGGPMRPAATLTYAAGALSKRTRRLSALHCAGYRSRNSRRIGMASPLRNRHPRVVRMAPPLPAVERPADRVLHPDAAADAAPFGAKVDAAARLSRRSTH